jgi:hypothetical protein
MAGTSLVTLSRWLAAGYEIAPQGRDWLDADDEYGVRGPIYVSRTGDRGLPGAGGNTSGVDMRHGDIYDDSGIEDDDQPVPAPPEPPERVWRAGPAWDALVEAGGFREAKPGRWGRPSIGRGVEVFIPSG